MSKKIKINLPSIIVTVITSFFVIGVLVVYANWTAPPAAPPTCPSSEPGCNAPINVGPGPQWKSGALGVGGVFRALNDAFFSGNVSIGSTPGNCPVGYHAATGAPSGLSYFEGASCPAASEYVIGGSNTPYRSVNTAVCIADNSLSEDFLSARSSSGCSSSVVSRMASQVIASTPQPASRLDVIGNINITGKLGLGATEVQGVSYIGSFEYTPVAAGCSVSRDLFCASNCPGFGGNYLSARSGGACGIFSCGCYAAVVK